MSQPMSNARTNPPHGVIAKEIRRGKVVPFLGAGVNFGGRPEKADWKLNASFLPSGKELSSYLATLSNLISDDPQNPLNLHFDQAKTHHPLLHRSR